MRQVAAEGDEGQGGPGASAPARPAARPSRTTQNGVGFALQGMARTRCFKNVFLLMREDDEELAAAGEEVGKVEGEPAGEAGWGPGGGPRGAASLAVALGKLLWRCQGRLAEGMGECYEMSLASLHPDGALGLLCGLHDVCVDDGVDTWHVNWAGRAAGKGGDTGADAQERERHRRRRRLWVCTYGAWRWLPAMACLAQRSAAAGHMLLDTDDTAALVWHPLLLWVKRLCMRSFRLYGRGAEEARRVSTGGGSSCGACGRAVRRCRCWREFLLQDVGVVGLVGTALRELVPKLLAFLEEEVEADLKMLQIVAEVVVLVAATFPDEVGSEPWVAPACGRSPAQGAKGCGRGKGGKTGCSSGGNASCGAASSSSASSALWPPGPLLGLGGCVTQWQGWEAMGQGLTTLGRWGEACVRSGRPEGLSAAQREELSDLAWDIIVGSGGGAEKTMEYMLLPPLCELRGFMRLCSNPRCAVLPSPGQSEAGAAAAAGRLEACPRGCGVAWYCCRECREEHWREGHGAACRGGGGGDGAGGGAASLTTR